MSEQDLEDSLRIARRELQLAVERHDEQTAEMLERAIIDLERREAAGVGRVLHLPDVPRQRADDDDAPESDEDL